MIEIKYKPYLMENTIFEEEYFLMTPNTLIEAIKESIINYGLILELSEAVALEIYKKRAVGELKKIINKISAENPTTFKNLNGNFNLEILPAIEPKDHKTQAYNVILDDISNIIAIAENTKKNIEKYAIMSDRDDDT